MQKRLHIVGGLALLALFSSITAFARNDGDLFRTQRHRNHPVVAASSPIREGIIDGRLTKFRTDEVIIKYAGNDRYQKVRIINDESVEHAIRRLSQQNNVVSVEPNYIVEAQFVPNDTYYQPYQWNFDNPQYGGIGAEEAWDISTGSGIVVAILDTGVAYENYMSPSFPRIQYYKAPDLAYTNFVPGYDFVHNDDHANDDEGHGTHVAGTIAQSTNNSNGVSGLAYHVSIMPIKVLNSNGSGTYSDMADAIRWAADNGAQVINMSLGGSSPASYLEAALAYAYDHGVTIVASAGNENSGHLLYPAAYDSYVIGVGATRYDETRAPYSNYGTALDIMAPGGDMTVDQNGDGFGDGILQQTFGYNYSDWGYYFYQGTSMAAPHITAVAAMVLANGNVSTPDAVRAALETTADDLGSSGWDMIYGWGLVNSVAALNYQSGAINPPDDPQPVDEAPSITITQPLSQAIFTTPGSILLRAEATDDIGIVDVSFYADGDFVSSDSSAPYEAYWDPSGYADGYYALKVVVRDTNNQIAEDTIGITIDVVNNAPVAYAGADVTTTVNLSVLFDGTGSSDSDGIITVYDWDYGDGDTGSGSTSSHSYTTAGNYTVTLTVTDDDGSTDNDTVNVSVAEQPDFADQIVVFADSFELSTWNGLWIEDSQNDWFRSTERSYDGRFTAQVDGRASNATLTSIPIELNGYHNAKITFAWFIEHYLDTGEYIAFDISTDGGTKWVEKSILQGNQDEEDVWHEVNLDIVNIDYLQIRFRGTMSRGNEEADIDMISVLAW